MIAPDTSVLERLERAVLDGDVDTLAAYRKAGGHQRLRHMEELLAFAVKNDAPVDVLPVLSKDPTTHTIPRYPLHLAITFNRPRHFSVLLGLQRPEETLSCISECLGTAATQLDVETVERLLALGADPRHAGSHALLVAMTHLVGRESDEAIRKSDDIIRLLWKHSSPNNILFHALNHKNPELARLCVERMDSSLLLRGAEAAISELNIPAPLSGPAGARPRFATRKPWVDPLLALTKERLKVVEQYEKLERTLPQTTGNLQRKRM